jgi:alpha-L-fucosidase
MRYEPTRQSVRQHSVPEWFDDAKLGIFVHCVLVISDP